MYQLVKQRLIPSYSKVQLELKRFNLRMNYRSEIKKAIQKNGIPELSSQQKKEAIAYYSKKGLSLHNTMWHQFYTGMSGYFHDNYLPEDIFHAYIALKLNNDLQWPALLDKNLYYTIFKGIKHPELIIKNVNGFFYNSLGRINEQSAIDEISENSDRLIIKPSIDSGAGKNIHTLSRSEFASNEKFKEAIIKHFKTYKRDFLIQKIVSQSNQLKALNPSSLNTIRVLSYLNGDSIHIMSALIRIGSKGSSTDNYSQGGLVCGIERDGCLKSWGIKKNGDRSEESTAGILLKGFKIPNFHLVLEMVENLHESIPYFRFVSWDIGLDVHNIPVFIEYNTYRQGIGFHQIVNGPFLGEFEEEIFREVFNNQL